MDVQTDKRKQQRQRNRGGDDQAGPKVVQEEDQHHDHQQHAAQQIVLDDLGGQRDQVGAVVIGHDLDVFGQHAVIEFVGLGLDALEHVLGFFAGAQKNDALDGVVLFLVAEFAQARSDADHHAAHVLEQNRGAVMYGQHDVTDVFQGVHTAKAAHVVELAALRIEAAAGVAVVGGQRRLDLYS